MTPLGQRLRDGGIAVAVTVNFPNASLMEFLCWCGFDALVLDGEHGIISDPLVEDLARTCEAANVTSVVRLPVARTQIERYAALGIDAFHLPQVEATETAQEAAQAMLFGPKGARGVGNFRAGHYGLATRDMPAFMERQNDGKSLIVAIESRTGIDELYRIVALDAVDVVLVGTSDLANDLGHPGETRHREVLAAVDQVASVVAEEGKALGLPAKTPAEVAEVLDRGARYILTSVSGIATPHLCDVVQAAHA